MLNILIILFFQKGQRKRRSMRTGNDVHTTKPRTHVILFSKRTGLFQVEITDGFYPRTIHILYALLAPQKNTKNKKNIFKLRLYRSFVTVKWGERGTGSQFGAKSFGYIAAFRSGRTVRERFVHKDAETQRFSRLQEDPPWCVPQG